jgi:NMD protein affecting ribosome stability and mRNA decay
MDFYFQSKNQGLRFIEFFNSNVPTKMKYSRKLVSADKGDNTANFKHNFLVDIVPICKVGRDRGLFFLLFLSIVQFL